jgi:hypothetical protein
MKINSYTVPWTVDRGTGSGNGASPIKKHKIFCASFQVNIKYERIFLSFVGNNDWSPCSSVGQWRAGTVLLGIYSGGENCVWFIGIDLLPADGFIRCLSYSSESSSLLGSLATLCMDKRKRKYWTKDRFQSTFTFIAFVSDSRSFFTISEWETKGCHNFSRFSIYHP